MTLFDSARVKIRQVVTTIGWTIELAHGSRAVIVLFIALSVLNALTEGFTVMLVVPILNATSGQNMFEGIPLLQKFGMLFEEMEPQVRLRWVAALILIIALLRGAIQYFVDIVVYIIPYTVDQALRIRALRALMTAKMSYLDSISVGQIKNYTSGFPIRVGLVARFLAQMLASLITVAFMLALLFAIAPGIWIAIGLFAVITSLAYKKLTGRMAVEVSRALTQDQTRYNSVYYEAIQNRRAIRIFRAGDLFISRLYQLIDRLRRVQVRTLAVQSATYPFFSTLAGAAVCMGIVTASFLQPDRSQALLALLVVALVILFRVIGPITTLHISRMHFATHVEAVEALHRFFGSVEKAVDPDGKIVLEHPRGEVVFDNVTFGYDGGKPVIDRLSFRVDPGEMIAIVGPSGTGKSTVFNLLARLYRPASGRILVDGIDLSDIAAESWWRNLAFVSQDIPIFMGTIAENITFGSRAVEDPVRLKSAARSAAAAEFIAKMPDGFDSPIGDGLRTLSGGERQRIALARAFYSQPRIVLFDEPTSQLDALAEDQVRSGIDALRATGCTVFVIAHRMATLQSADRIIVLDEGRVESIGSFGELRAAGGLFSRMVKSQLIRQ